MTNKLFPGRPNYTGPKSGPFGLLHHGKLWEWSHDVIERVDYVQREKPENERAIRLHNMIFLGGCSVFKGKSQADYNKACVDWDKTRADYHKAFADLQKVWADWYKVWADLDKAQADYHKVRAAWNRAHPNANAKILAYIRKHIPDCAWNGKELIFPALWVVTSGEW